MDDLAGQKAGKSSRTKLTKKTVDALQPREKRYVVWDADLPGFGCEVMPGGGKSFRLIYRPRGSRRTRVLTLGRLGSITPDEARNLAKDGLADIRKGSDPAETLARTRRQESLTEAFEAWLANQVERKRKASTARGYRDIWKSHIKEALGARPLSEISRADINALHRKMANSPYQANRTVAVLRAFFNFAERQDLRAPNSNPARLISLYAERKRGRVLSADELSRLGAALLAEEAADGRDLERHWAVAAVRLLLFTGARKSEILNLRWAEVNLDAGTARLPDSKTGEKTIYLSAPAREVLASLQRMPGNPFVIPGRKPQARLVGLLKVWERIRKRAELPDLRIHDLRHGFASTAAMQGLSLPSIGRLLGHSQPAMTDRYAHFQSAPLVSASDVVANVIQAQLAAKPTTPGGEDAT